jgi:hypothetical protein
MARSSKCRNFIKDKSTVSEVVTEATGTEAAMADLGGAVGTGEWLDNVELIEGAAARFTG